MKTNLTLVFLTTSILSGCANDAFWKKSGVTGEEYNYDVYYCQSMANSGSADVSLKVERPPTVITTGTISKTGPNSYYYSGVSTQYNNSVDYTPIAKLLLKNSIFNDCMKSKGYALVSVDNLFSKIGEYCAQENDCFGTGGMCINHVCTDPHANEPKFTEYSRKLGEACYGLRDCEGKLNCIGNVCKE